jgi:hypothetical protein
MRSAIAVSSMILLLATAVALQAAAPRSSLRPQPRGFGVGGPQSSSLPSAAQTVTRSNVKVFYSSSIRPRARGFGTINPPNNSAASAVSTVTTATFVSTQIHGGGYQLATTLPVFRSPRPLPRGQSINASNVQNVSYQPSNNNGLSGSVCGDPAIRGKRIASIPAARPGCGVSQPVRVESIGNISLTGGATMDCTTAKSVKYWVLRGVKPVIGQRGGGLKSIKVIADYSCRTRNSKPGAKISEHGKGHAIDVAAFNLADGSSISVLDDWRGSRNASVLRKLHRSACGPFGTVLGPEADKYHQDHFHLDTARHRSGSYCR